MTKLYEHLVLTQAGKVGFFLYDKLRGHNVAMKAATEREAYIEAINGYSTALDRVLKERNELLQTIDKLKDILCPDEDNH